MVSLGPVFSTLTLLNPSELLFLSVKLVSRPGEFHPQPLAEPYRNLSIHTAPIKQTLLPFLASSVRTTAVVASQFPPRNAPHVSYSLSGVCIPPCPCHQGWSAGEPDTSRTDRTGRSHYNSRPVGTLRIYQTPSDLSAIALVISLESLP